MKNCMIRNLYPPHILGGAEIIVDKLVRNIASKNHDVIVITCSGDDKEHIQKEKNITI